MSFVMSDIQAMIADSLGRLLGEKNAFEDRRHRLSAAQPDRLALWPSLAALGILGTVLPEEKGGSGGTMRDIAVVMAALGRTLTVEPYLAAAMCARILLASDGAAAETALAALVSGERVLAFVPEPGFDPFAEPRLTAAQSRGRWALSGVCPLVRHADIANDFVVSARLEGGAEIGCFLVGATASAVAIEPFRLIDAASAGSVVFTRAAGALLLSGSAAASARRDALETGIVGLAAESVGIMRALNAATFEYLRTRKQFGASLASFQALQHRAADMHIAAEEAEILTERAIEAFEQAPGAPRSALVAALKVLADASGRRIGHEAVQLHGGMGVSDELDVSHHARRLTAIRAELGHADSHRSRFLALTSYLSNAVCDRC